MLKHKDLTGEERRAAWSHAKAHVLAAIEDVLYQEHHSVMQVDGKTRRDLQQATMDYLEDFKSKVKSVRYKPLNHRR